MLFAEVRIRIPTGIEQDEKRLDVVFVCNLKENLNTLLETLRVLLPRKVVEKHSHSVEADGFGPAQFHIDSLCVERIGLPHFQFVDGGGWDVVASNEPGLPGVPIRGGLFCPAMRRWRLCHGARGKSEGHQEAGSNFPE